MAIKWGEECLQKYGEEVSLNLIKQQQEYEKENVNNDCIHCGKLNKGTIAELKKGTPFVIHYGLWVDGRCSFCGRYE